MCFSKRKEERQAELEQWDSKQYPPPTSEAEILEEELAKASHSIVRGWAKTLLECNEAFLDSFGHYPGEHAGSSVNFHRQSEVNGLPLAVQEAYRH